jgi:hypothetical protein
MSRLVDKTGPVKLGMSGLAAFETVMVHAAYHARYLRLDGRRAYEIGNGCETCTFWFTRLEGANRNASVEETRSRLAEGIEAVADPAIEQFSKVLGNSRYEVLLLDLEPKPEMPADPGGYFAQEQVDLWGIDGFWGLPHYTHVPYYRAPDIDVTADALLFEFVVPMYPAGWLDAGTIEGYSAQLERSEKPTAVALSVLDVKQPANWADGTAVNTHWCLAHYLLDGHHKLSAAAASGQPIRLVSFLAVDEGVSSPENIETLLRLLGGTAA